MQLRACIEYTCNVYIPLKWQKPQEFHILQIKKSTTTGKVFPCTHQKGIQGNNTYCSSHLNLSARWKWVVNIIPWFLYPRKEPPHRLNRRLGGSHSCSECFGGQKNLFPLLKFKLGTDRVDSTVTYQLHYSSSQENLYFHQNLNDRAWLTF